MYNLPYFKDQNAERVLQFMREHPFVFLAGTGSDGKPVATQVPVFIDERDGRLYLTGHIMKNSDHHKAFLFQSNVLAVFTGASTYVSASWYENKKEASTWNYMSVHARGEMRFLEHEDLLKVLKRTTDHFENNPDSGSNFHDLSSEYVERLSKAIVGFEISVQHIDNVFKLSQNRKEKSYDQIIEKLESQDTNGQYIASQMKNRREELF